MQGGATDHNTAYIYRFKDRNRSYCAGTANLELNILQYGGGLGGCKFCGNSPSRASCLAAKTLLQLKGVNFNDHAVNIVGQGLTNIL